MQELSEEDLAQDRRGELVAALLCDDLLMLMDATREELEGLSQDEGLMRSIPDGRHVLNTAQWWGYMKDQAKKGSRPFILPPVVRTNLHWKGPVDSIERVTADDFPHY